MTRCVIAIAVFAFTLSSTVLGAPQTLAQGKEPIVIHVDHAAPPPTLAELYDKSRVVLVGTVKLTEQSMVVPAASPNAPTPLLKHSIVVDEVLKNDGSVTLHGTVVVSEFAGTVAWGNQSITVDMDGADIPKDGERGLFFLNDYPAGRSYTPSASGMFLEHTSNNKVWIPRPCANMPELMGASTMSLNELLGIVRKLSRR